MVLAMKEGCVPNAGRGSCTSMTDSLSCTIPQANLSSVQLTCICIHDCHITPAMEVSYPAVFENVGVGYVAINGQKKT